MPDLSFSIEGAEPIPYAAAPALALKLRIVNRHPHEQIQSILLQCQIQIEATRRRYSPAEQAHLRDLFGEPERWSQTLRAMLWTLSSVNVKPFSGDTLVDVPVPCTFDFNVAATKYFHGLASGDVPLNVLFSGTIFYHSDESGLQVAQIPWEREAQFRLPMQTWRSVIDIYYPNQAWFTLRRDVFEQLLEYKVRWGLPTWEQTIDRLLAGVTEGVAS